MNETQKKYVAEDFLTGANKLLEDIDVADSFIKDLPTRSVESVNSEIREKSLESIVQSVDPSTPGYAEVSISEDEMRAIGDFFPPSEGIEPLKPEDVAMVLSDKEITQGVDWDMIRDAIFKCNTGFEPVTDVVVAKGCEPADEIPEHLEIEAELLRGKVDEDSNKTRIDFKEISPFVLVKMGVPLAHVVPAKPGKTGFTVSGRTLPFRKAKVAQLKPGNNTKVEGNAVVSSCEGRFESDSQGFWVNEVLEVSHDVDYRTGHIDFPGDVIIRGEIQDGIKVHAGGSIYCAGTMDASEVTCEKDVIVQRGIIGKKEGILRAEGIVKAKFIENCYVQAKGTISIEVGMITSSIHTLDRVELGSKGIITGGKTHAQNGVTATQLGSQSGTKTEIYCGTDYSVEQKLEWIRDKNIELAMKLGRVREQIKRATSEEKEIIELRDNLQAAIHKMNEAASTLVNHLDKNDEVEIIVRGNVYPGVYIEICHVSHIVNRKVSGVRFRLDKAKGKIVVAPLARATRD
jgi:uncharacterized protein